MLVYLLRFLLAAAIFCLWQFLPPLFGTEFFFSTPIEIGHRLVEFATRRSLFMHAGVTAIEAGGGFLVGGAVGMFLGILLGRWRLLAEVLAPFLTAFYSLPKVALAPLFVLWFGIGIDMKIFLAGTIVFFLVFLNTFSGVREVSQEQISILRLMGARERHLLTKVIIPSAVIWMFAGLRLSVPYAVIGAVVGEIIAANRGLGYLVANSASQFDTAGIFAALFSLIVLALSLNMMVQFAERRLMPWRAAELQREVSV